MMKYLSNLDWWKQLSANVGGVLAALLACLSILNVHYDWLNADSINAVVAFIVAIGTLFVGSFATIVNTYLTNRSKQKAVSVVDDYKAQLQAMEQEELEKFKANLEKVQSQSK